MGFISDAVYSLGESTGINDAVDAVVDPVKDAVHWAGEVTGLDKVGDAIGDSPVAKAVLTAVAAYYGMPYLTQFMGLGATGANTAAAQAAAWEASAGASMGMTTAEIATNLAATGMSQTAAMQAATMAAAGATESMIASTLANGANTAAQVAYARDAASMGMTEAEIGRELVSMGMSNNAAGMLAADAASGTGMQALLASYAPNVASDSFVSTALDKLTNTTSSALKDPSTWVDVLNNVANVAGGAYLADQSSSLFRDLARQSTALGQDYANKIGAAGADASSKASFKPYTVTSGLGGTSVTPEGLSYNLSPQQQAITDSLMSQAQNMASKDAYVSPEGLFSTLQAMSDPVNARTRLAMENRLSAQGRLGTATAAYGGTPEQLAMEIAMQEQLAKNAWQSQIGASQLTGQNLTNQGAALGTAYKPYDQMQGMMTQALQGQQLAQNVGNTQAEIAYKTALAQAAAALEGQKTAMGYNTMGSMQNLGMMQGLIGQGANGTNNLVNTASGLFDLGKKVYSLF